MLVAELFVWWYGAGWVAAAKNIGRMLSGVSRLFAIPILLRTLFAPWKRIVSLPGASLEAKMRAYGDNLVSRAVGFTVRFFVLITALLTSAAVAVAGVLGFVLWPLVPLGIVALVGKGLIG